MTKPREKGTAKASSAAAPPVGATATTTPIMASPLNELKRKLKADFGGWPVLLLVAFLGARQFSIFWVDVPVTSCPEDMLLTERTDKLFDEASRLKFLQTAVDHPLSASNQLSQQFVGSRGFVLKFNSEGASQLSSRSDLSFLTPFFRKVRDPQANAFVLNVLIIQPDEANESTKPAIGLHVDNTVGIDSARLWVAHSVSVYYLQVPAEMEGGVLELYADLVQKKRPDERVYPTEGDLVTFRGDAYHRVTQVRQRAGAEAPPTATESLRVSLVLEQYRIPERLYAHTFEFKISDKDDHRTYAPTTKSWLNLFNNFSKMIVVAICAVAGVQHVAERLGIKFP